MLQGVDQGHQVLETEVDYGEHDGKYDSAYQDQERRTLQLLPGRPCRLVYKLNVALFQVIDKLSHLYI